MCGIKQRNCTTFVGFCETDFFNGDTAYLPRRCVVLILKKTISEKEKQDDIP